MNDQITITATGMLKRPHAFLPSAEDEEEYVFVLATQGTTQGLVRSDEHGWHDGISYIKVTTRKVPPCLAEAKYGDPIRVTGHLNAGHLIDFQGREKSDISIVATRISLPYGNKNSDKTNALRVPCMTS